MYLILINLSFSRWNSKVRCARRGSHAENRLSQWTAMLNYNKVWAVVVGAGASEIVRTVGLDFPDPSGLTWRNAPIKRDSSCDLRIYLSKPSIGNRRTACIRDDSVTTPGHVPKAISCRGRSGYTISALPAECRYQRMSTIAIGPVHDVETSVKRVYPNSSADVASGSIVPFRLDSQRRSL